MNLYRYLVTGLLLCITTLSTAQQVKENNMLFTTGHAAAFIGGLYDGFYPYKNLKQHGDFGLGAPHQLDGELVLLNGSIYQTQSSGKTFEVKAGNLTPFSVVNFFHSNITVKVNSQLTKEKLFAYLDSLIPKQNNIYAIHIKGKFSIIKTRAFSVVNAKPYPALASMLSLQHFFTFNSIYGDLVGYRIPAFMEGPNISGYHFHFLSTNKQHGGHIIDLLTDGVIIEIQLLKSFKVVLPQTNDFVNFDFKKDRSEEIKKVENGKN